MLSTLGIKLYTASCEYNYVYSHIHTHREAHTHTHTYAHTRTHTHTHSYTEASSHPSENILDSEGVLSYIVHPKLSESIVYLNIENVTSLNVYCSVDYKYCSVDYKYCSVDYKYCSVDYKYFSWF